MAAQESFESIMIRTFPGDEAEKFDTLNLTAEQIAAVEMREACPQISIGTALYTKGLELELAYQKRDELICEPDDPRDESSFVDGEEWELTCKRRKLFRRMYKEVETELIFSNDLKERVEVIRDTIKNTHADIAKDAHWQEIAPIEAGELSELTTHLGLLFELEVDQHFQKV